MMEIGVVFPQTDFPPDAVAVRDYAQTVEDLGFTHVLSYDHVLGANPDRPGGWRGPYTYEDPFFSPFLLYSYMAAVTDSLGFITGILILPQRQTALVAKQAATLDVLCEGRFRLGIGVGWNSVEYTALGQDFHTRGRREEEQVEVLRKLWTQPLVTYEGEWHQIPDAGLRPLPVQQPIPIWFGGYADIVLRRMARLGAGWLPGHRTAEEAEDSLDRLGRYLDEAGRSWDDFGLEPRLHYQDARDDERWQHIASRWRAVGATHLSVNTMGAGLATVSEHIDALGRVAEALGVGA